MGTKPKTRFTAFVDGIEIELFNVRDRGEKGLIITAKTPRFFEGGEPGESIEFGDQHYTVHPTEGDRTTVTQKTALLGAPPRSEVAMLQNTREHLLWPVYSRRQPTFPVTDARANVRPRDRPVVIAEYEIESATFLYSVFVASLNFDPSGADDQGVMIFVEDFQLYRLVVIATYLNIPSHRSGDVCSFSTSATHVGSEPPPLDHFRIERGPFQPSELMPVHWELMGALRTKLMGRWGAFYSNRPEALPLVHALTRVFTPIPAHKRIESDGEIRG